MTILGSYDIWAHTSSFQAFEWVGADVAAVGFGILTHLDIRTKHWASRSDSLSCLSCRTTACVRTRVSMGTVQGAMGDERMRGPSVSGCVGIGGRGYTNVTNIQDHDYCLSLSITHTHTLTHSLVDLISHSPFFQHPTRTTSHAHSTIPSSIHPHTHPPCVSSGDTATSDWSLAAPPGCPR